METNPVSRRYETRSATAQPVAKSRVDWNRTKRYVFPESQDDDDKITLSSSSSSSSSSEKDPKSSSKEDGKEDETSILSKNHDEAGSDADLQKGCRDASSEDLEEGNISFGKRKRHRTAMMYDSGESSDSDVPRKVIAKGRSRSADDAPSPLTQEEIDLMSQEDSMKDFIDDDDVDDDDEEEEKLEWDNFEEEDYQHQDRKHHGASNLLEKHIPFVSEVDYYLHFQRVVKAFLINAVDDTFLSSLYEGKRKKKYAQDMETSLYYFDTHFIEPYLESLASGCRWKPRYKTRVDSYSDVRISPQCSQTRKCQACELDRDCRFVVTFSGKEYCHQTLKEDDFLPDDTQRLKVGVVCQRRTQAYHDLKHYKYKLYQKCCSAIRDQCLQDEPVKDVVKRVFSQLEEKGWIRKEYSNLEKYQAKVAEFQKYLKDFRNELCSFERSMPYF